MLIQQNANTLFEAGDDLWAASTQIGGLVRLGKIKAISPITNATCDLTNADATVTCDATDLIYVGMSVGLFQLQVFPVLQLLLQLYRDRRYRCDLF